MRCPFCGHLHDKVVDSRESKEGDAIRRRRQCLGCQRRFTSYERIDEIPYMVVKKDGRRETIRSAESACRCLKGLREAAGLDDSARNDRRQGRNDGSGFQ